MREAILIQPFCILCHTTAAFTILLIFLFVFFFHVVYTLFCIMKVVLNHINFVFFLAAIHLLSPCL